ncbi:penicillin-binding transpeptidase domain-containing protein [Jeotgalibacillus proteolyticus]|uniref:Peptidoglycan glycosyltransferase n=1 Tax=Jeotgalibacillus proteolyticus TaxID=2082395 RepID=A0A2S5GD71_9BACL|nr:penicillin-binding transpeptidase domain-containing protein [Jeotgalibacillus proteolyticus]PPA70950.1 peptidoglycan glycosyltransferase [Jeotgalibacillus proteolyticus]
MKNKLSIFLFLAAAAVLGGCTEQETPDNRLDEYISLWNEQDFSAMYSDYTAAESKDLYTEEQSVTRTEFYYEEIEVNNLEVSMQDIPEDAEWNESEPAELTVNVFFDTLAGPVQFDKEVTLLFEEQGEEENWFVQWDPSFILPELEQDDVLRFSSTQGVRGEIYDRNGNPLAINGTGYEVGAVPGELNDEDKEALAEGLSMSVETIDERFSQGWVEDDLLVPLKQFSSAQREEVVEITEQEGVYSQSAEMREYPFGEAISHLTGYVGAISAEQLEENEGEGYTASDVIGKRGLEQLLEERLRSIAGNRIYIEKAGDEGETVTVAEQEAHDGEDITLTIDAELQKTTFEAMKGEPGTAAAVDPETGETLVLASSPGFDPGEFSLGVSSERYTELEEDPNQPLQNRFSTIYAPGSTQKTLTAAIGLEAGTLDPNEGFTINGLTWQKDNWGDFRVTRVHEAQNPIDLNKGLVFSDNIYFAQVALGMGAETLINGLEELGYEEELPFAYPFNRPSQISNDGSIGSEGQLVDTSYGQGEMLTNILHLASMYEIVVNDGVMMKPLLFEEEEPEVWKEGLLSSENAEILRKDLREVVTVGFASPADIPEATIAGKTGTAELKQAGEETGRENGFFVAYDEDNPEFIIAMMVEEVQDKGGSTYVSELTADVFKNR